MTKFTCILAILLVVTGQAMCETQEDNEAKGVIIRPLRVITEEDTSAVSPKIEKAAPSPSAQSQARGHGGKPCGRCSRRGAGFGGGGGFAAGYLFSNLGEINRQIRRMGIEEINEDLFVMGGKGYARIGCFIIGGGGYATEGETSGIPDRCARYAQVEIAYGGVIFGLARQTRSYELTGGILLGSGSIVVERRRNSRYVVGWNDAWDIFDVNSPDSVAVDDLNVTSRLTANFIAIEPFVELKYRLMSFVALEVTVSYLRAKTGYGQWKLDNIKIPNSPATNIGGPGLRVGLHFGA